MASTTFIDGSTPITASWLNDVNKVVYTLISVNGSVPNNLDQLVANLGLSGMARQSASSVGILGGSINNTTIGATTASSGKFTTLWATGATTLEGTLSQRYSGLTRATGIYSSAVSREYTDMNAVSTTVLVAQSSVGTTVSLSSTVGIYPGYAITGTGIAANTLVSSVSPTQITMTLSSTSALAAGATLTFLPQVGQIELGTTYNYSITTNTSDVSGASYLSKFDSTNNTYSFKYAPSLTAGVFVPAGTWNTPFTFDLTTGNFKSAGYLGQEFAGLTRLLTPSTGARIREYIGVVTNTVGGCEVATTYNCSVNTTTGVWAGRDIADACWVQRVSDSAPFKNSIWFAASDVAGAVPTWVLNYSLDFSTGSLSLGTLTSTSTTTPTYCSLGGTYSTELGTYNSSKLRVYDATTSMFGLGATATSGVYNLFGTNWSGGHTFYNNSVLQATVGSSTSFLSLPGGTTTKSALVIAPGSKLTTAVQGGIEFDSTNLYFTPSVSVGRKKISLISEVIYSLPTVGAGTMTASGLINGVVFRTGPTAAFTDTTDTATNITSLTSAVVGTTFTVLYVNTTAFAATIAAGTGVALLGIAPTAVAAGGCKEYIGVVNSGSSVSLYGI